MIRWGVKKRVPPDKLRQVDFKQWGNITYTSGTVSSSWTKNTNWGRLCRPRAWRTIPLRGRLCRSGADNTNWGRLCRPGVCRRGVRNKSNPGEAMSLRGGQHKLGEAMSSQGVENKSKFQQNVDPWRGGTSQMDALPPRGAELSTKTGDPLRGVLAQNDPLPPSWSR